jgi:hypothetical protein
MDRAPPLVPAVVRSEKNAA